MQSNIINLNYIIMVKPMKRSALSAKLNAIADQLVLGVLFITSVRATANNTLSIEMCMNRVLEGSKISALGLLNQSDERFGTSGTLLFDWAKATPKDLLKVFPEIPLTLADLEAIAATWKEDAPTGKDATVYPIMKTITKMMFDKDTHYTPIIVVSEATESQIRNGEFFTDASKNQDQNIAGALDENYRVMRTGPVEIEGTDFIVEAATGDRIFRYTRTEAKEQNPQDILISGKITRKQYDARVAKRKATTGINPEEILENETEALAS